MKRHSLTADKRTLVGKKVKKLRQEGLMPVSVYGKDISSLVLQVPIKDFRRVYEEAGKTGLVDLKVDATVYPSLIKNVQVHPVSGHHLHAEFHKVALTDKITANIPVELVGQSSVVRDGVGLLLHTLNEVEVEALPMDLPESIQVDVTKLVAIGDQIIVSDLSRVDKVEIKTGADSVIVKVAPVVSDEAKKEAEAEAAAAAATQAAGTAEGVPVTKTPETETKAETPADEKLETEKKAQ